jgi:hypothetical protein
LVFNLFFPIGNDIEIFKWMAFHIEYINLNHYVIPYLINDTITDDHLILTLPNGLLWSVLFVKSEPP